MYEREDEHLATPSEAVAEFAHNYGMDHPELAWLLHDWDVWVANPFYIGPKVPHPEDDYASEEAPGFDTPVPPNPDSQDEPEGLLSEDDDIPF